VTVPVEVKVPVRVNVPVRVRTETQVQQPAAEPCNCEAPPQPPR